MIIRKQQIPETVLILNTPLTADIDKHDDDDDVTNHYFEGQHPLTHSQIQAHCKHTSYFKSNCSATHFSPAHNSSSGFR
jgi:hypothetical protein